MPIYDAVEPFLHRGEELIYIPADIMERTLVVVPAIVSTTVRYSCLDRRAESVQVVRQIARCQCRTYRGHAASDVYTYCRRDDRALGGDDTTYRRAAAPVNVWHDS